MINLRRYIYPKVDLMDKVKITNSGLPTFGKIGTVMAMAVDHHEETPYIVLFEKYDGNQYCCRKDMEKV